MHKQFRAVAKKVSLIVHNINRDNHNANLLLGHTFALEIGCKGIFRSIHIILHCRAIIDTVKDSET